MTGFSRFFIEPVKFEKVFQNNNFKLETLNIFFSILKFQIKFYLKPLNIYKYKNSSMESTILRYRMFNEKNNSFSIYSLHAV